MCLSVTRRVKSDNKIVVETFIKALEIKNKG